MHVHLLRLSLLLHGGVMTLGLAWAFFRGRPWVLAHPAPALALEPVEASLISLGGGLLLMLVTVGFTRWSTARYRWAKGLNERFRAIIGRPPLGVIVGLALFSGVGEEVFFRGALQPDLGLWFTSLLFGLAHIPGERKMWPWTLWALVMGLMLGALHEVTGSLAGPIVAHVGINGLNLRAIAKSRDEPFPRPLKDM